MNSTVQSFYKPDEDCKDISWLIEPGQFLIKVFNEVYGYFEDTLRKNHPKDSAKFIRDKADSLFSYMDAAFASFVAKVSESHGYDAVEVYWMKSNAAGDTISLKYLMILLRMADLFDVAYDRVNYYLLKQQLNQMSPASKFHWISHLITNRIELSADYSVDEKKELYDKPVTETLNVNLFLNFKNLTAISVGLRCKNCRYKSAKDHLCIEINDRTTGETQCKKKKCPFLCRWMTIKHEWLIRELSTLSDYLASANNSMIQTKIRLNIYYSDQPNLNKEMAKAVQDYLATLSP